MFQIFSTFCPLSRRLTGFGCVTIQAPHAIGTNHFFFLLPVFVGRGREFLEYFGGSHGLSGDGVGNSCRQQRIERLNSIQFYLNINIKNKVQ